LGESALIAKKEHTMIWKKSETEEAPAKDHAQSQPPPAPASRFQQQPARERAIIGATIELKGNLIGNEDLLIEGRIEGKIELQQHSVTIGKNGRVKADIFGRHIVVMGEVDGNLYGEEQIVLNPSSKVNGNLFAPRVTLEDGSQFRGSIDMTTGPAAGSEPAQQKTPAASIAAQES
jgi:cytoskeletal protein CcmA (bactofilin family)